MTSEFMRHGASSRPGRFGQRSAQRPSVAGAGRPVDRSIRVRRNKQRRATGLARLRADRGAAPDPAQLAELLLEAPAASGGRETDRLGSSTWGAASLVRGAGRPTFTAREIDLVNALAQPVARKLRSTMLTRPVEPQLAVAYGTASCLPSW